MCVYALIIHVGHPPPLLMNMWLLHACIPLFVQAIPGGKVYTCVHQKDVISNFAARYVLDHSTLYELEVAVARTHAHIVPWENALSNVHCL